MSITLKAFHFVMYSLLIYSSFRYKLTRIAAEDPVELGRKVNRVSGAEERNILILNERISDTSSSRERFKREAERTYDAGKAESHTTIDDEDGELEENAELSSGDSMRIQGDERASSPNNGDQNPDAPNPEINTTSVHVIASTANAHVDVIISTTASLTTSPEAASTSSVHGANTTTATVTTAMLVFITSHATTDEPNTIDIEASVFSSVKSTFSTAIITSSRSNTRDSTQPSTVGALGASIALPSALPTKPSSTSETSPKGGNNVQNQREPSPKPKDKKTLFGFVTIEILVALLAGAACAVILLIFLVHRLKKRNEGSYELQETLMLKSGGYAEEKEVFV